MGTGWTKLVPLVFHNILRNPPEFFETKLGIFRGFNLWCFNGRIILGVNPAQSYGENTKNPIQDFIDFGYENPLKNWKEILKNCFSCDKFCEKNQFLIGFYNKIYEILDRAFCIFPITLG